MIEKIKKMMLDQGMVELKYPCSCEFDDRICMCNIQINIISRRRNVRYYYVTDNTIKIGLVQFNKYKGIYPREEAPGHCVEMLLCILEMYLLKYS